MESEINIPFITSDGVRTKNTYYKISRAKLEELTSEFMFGNDDYQTGNGCFRILHLATSTKLS